MASSTDPALELQELQEYFAGRLPDRMREIEDAWKAVQASGWTAGPLRELHRLAHSLTGAGATFGFPEVTRAARELERFLKARVDSPGPDAEGSFRQVEELVDDLRRAAGVSSAPAPEPPPVPARQVSDASPTEERLVFLIEDDEELGSALAAQIRHFGYGVRILGRLDGLAAEVERDKPEVLVVDAGNAAAIAATSAIRSPAGPGPRIVFLSERTDLEARLEAVRAGGDAYFTKPVDVGAVVEKLDLLTVRQAGSPYRILIVEDDPDLSIQYAGTLEAAGMKTRVVADPLEVMEPLYAFRPDLILMDVHMGECTGPELAAVLRQQEGYLSTPIVFLSAVDGLAEQLEALDLGGDEFLTKPIEPRHLVSAVATRARRGRMLQSLISHDGLTGLLNHSNLKLHLEAELARASRDETEVAYAMIDLDLFKSINDTYGHPAGDRLLRSLALFLRQRLRRSDILGRYGGDELAVILPRTDGPTAVRVLERIRENFAQLRHRAGDREISATLSCGVATFPDHPDSERLLEAADAALYAAKRGGRNRVELG